MDDGVDDPGLDESSRTPGYHGWQRWRAHCGTTGLGHVGARELRALGVLEEVLDDPWDDEQKEMIRGICQWRTPECYLFRCLHCGKHLVWWILLEDIECLCPECISKRRGGRKYDGSFQDDCSVDDGWRTRPDWTS